MGLLMRTPSRYCYLDTQADEDYSDRRSSSRISESRPGEAVARVGYERNLSAPLHLPPSPHQSEPTMVTPPITPRHQSIKDFTHATPLTPRSSTANEIKARHQIAHTVTLSISHFTSLIAELTPSSPLPSLFSPPKSERTRLDRIEEFRQDFLCGAFMHEQPPELVEDDFSDGARTSLGGVSTIASSIGGGADETLPRSLLARGILAERTIKSHLRGTGVLLSHRNFKSLPAIARRAMSKTLAQGRPVFVSCGLLRAPNFSQEYEERGWAAPGIRWGNFKPDLVRFVGKGEGEVVWDVVEVKYSASAKDVVSFFDCA